MEALPRTLRDCTAATGIKGEACLNFTTRVGRCEPVIKELDEEKTKEKTEKKRKKKKNLIKGKESWGLDDGFSQTASSSSFPGNSARRVSGVAFKRRNPAVRVGSVRRNVGLQELDGLALTLGMSIAALVNLVLEKKDETSLGMPIDNFRVIFTSAVRESLANVYGDRFDTFVENFERSFTSTLRTLSLIKESSMRNPERETYHLGLQNQEASTAETGCSNSGSRDVPVPIEDLVEDDLNQNEFYDSEEFQQSSIVSSVRQELNGGGNQLLQLSRNLSGPLSGGMWTMERSVMEQSRANDLKVVELGLKMRKLSLKDTELALNFESNNLEKTKLEMGRSKASFRVEKFKTELEETRHAELLKRCIDCLVAGLLLMIASLLYGAYVFSYHKITEFTAACTPSPEEQRFSWWLPKQVTSMNLGLNTLKCKLWVSSRMGFGFLMIIVIAWSIGLRASPSKQAMPLTYILLLLGVLCGFAGKLCVDTLGGSGSHWLTLWETLCALHFLANVWTSALFVLLYGPINVSGTKSSGSVPYCFRRGVFYSVALVGLPVSCGLLPFASVAEWRDHFSQLLVDLLSGDA